MADKIKTTEVKTEFLIKLQQISEGILKGDYTMRIVADFEDVAINHIINNLNQHLDNLLVNPREDGVNPTASINHFIDTISSFANHDFHHKLPISNNGNVLDAIATSINILGEELEQSTASRKELNYALNVANDKNQRLLNFSYIISHNLRSHTSNIKSLLDLLDATASEKERGKIIKYLNTSSNALNETIVNLNEVVSIHTKTDLFIEQLDLHVYVNKAARVLSEQISLKNVTLNNNVSKELRVSYNPAYMESILLNFISNSIKYSRVEIPPVISIDCLKEEDKFVLSIRDNGMGIDLGKHKDKLFGMYKTFHDNIDARGIGLFISKNQIDAMGGKVEVESEVNKGTTFKIYIK